MHREYHRWFSPALGRDMELLVFGRSGARVLVFPTRAGRFFDYENWGLVDAVRHNVEGGCLQLYCVDSVDAESLYASWRPAHERILRHMQYERYILEEVVPFSERKNPQSPLVAHGCSIGAYHAVNLVLRHPHRFASVVGLSGRYDLTRPTGGFPDLFSGHYDENIYFHTPNHFLPNLNDPRILGDMRRLRIVLVVGSEDPFADSNRELSDALWRKGLYHVLDFWQGEAHRPAWWRQMARRYL